MKTIYLSNHTAAKIAEASERRQIEYGNAVEAHKETIADMNNHTEQLRKETSEAWNDMRLWAAFKGCCKLFFNCFTSTPSAPQMRAPGREETIWRSGHEGEELVTDFLSRHLSDDWTLVSGYRNRKGEIDHVLVGPRGILAIEIKYTNGHIYCDGDEWRRDKYDRYGNLVETGIPIRDRSGRGPSRQLNEPADQLQWFLAKRTGVDRIHRAIVFSHSSSRLGECKNLTVDFALTVAAFDVDKIFSKSTVSLDQAAVERVVKAIGRRRFSVVCGFGSQKTNPKPASS